MCVDGVCLLSCYVLLIPLSYFVSLTDIETCRLINTYLYLNLLLHETRFCTKLLCALEGRDEEVVQAIWGVDIFYEKMKCT